MEHFGEPTNSIRFDDGKKQAGWPDLIDVFIWDPEPDLDITTFSTIGMSAEPLPGVSHRAELHFAVRQQINPEVQKNIAHFLANVAMYPFHYSTAIDWWHRLRDPGNVPLFSTAQSLLFHPRFAKEGWDRIDYDGVAVKLLNAIPITAVEYEIKPVGLIAEEWAKNGTDIFSPR